MELAVNIRAVLLLMSVSSFAPIAQAPPLPMTSRGSIRPNLKTFENRLQMRHAFTAEPRREAPMSQAIFLIRS